MPRTTSDHTFTNSKEWLDTAIKISGSKKGGTFESAYPIANHLLKNYKDSFLAACETQRVPVIKPIPSHAVRREGKRNRGKRIEEANQLTSWYRLLFDKMKREHLHHHRISGIFKRYLFRRKPRENPHHTRRATETGNAGGGDGRRRQRQGDSPVVLLLHLPSNASASSAWTRLETSKAYG